ncbi:hypothetical protein BDA99DRAFT_562311 [Phascolomyces articulosus]|uniref:C2H2-type domain-containing protein n=1 Tax=Phascolomyces articulosus TaxID=60185 RepID=A0AAD5PDA4_9FUNG|nr:hypothetical protein BDA99DRAFT_562311 [Phascolomyces articulosus]
MSSTLTFQLRNSNHGHQLKDELTPTSIKKTTTEDLPSPPTSTYSSDEGPNDLVGSYGFEGGNDSIVGSIGSFSRRDSLPTHFNALTIQQFSTSLPENYTIEHNANASNKKATTLAPLSAAAPSSSMPKSIPIFTTASPFQLQYRRHSTRPESLAHSPASVATAAATGGRTIRQRRQSESSTLNGRKALHRCDDCGKVYKHPNCLSKHRWEHSEQWELTSKLLLTKHQQVQMLEAAAILVSLDSSRQGQGQWPSVENGYLEEEDEGGEEENENEMDGSNRMTSPKIAEEEEENDDDDVEVFIDDMEEDGEEKHEMDPSKMETLNFHPRRHHSF